MPHDGHIPERIIIGTNLEYAGLAQCSCGLVAPLVDWNAGSWPKKPHEDLTFSLKWELEEDVWREPDEAEQGFLSKEPNALTETLWPTDFQL